MLTPKCAQDTAVLRFVAGGKVHCFGHLDRGMREDVVQVAPYIKMGWSEPTYYGIRVRFPHEDVPSGHMALFHDDKFHTVVIKFKPDSFTNVTDYVVTDETEFRESIQEAPEHVHAKAKEAFKQEKLYRITFTYEEDAIARAYYTNLYTSSVPEIQAIFDSMQHIPVCKTLSVFMWKYTGLRAHLQHLYRTQHNYEPVFDPYWHKYKSGRDA